MLTPDSENANPRAPLTLTVNLAGGGSRILRNLLEEVVR
jgi:hypothetical protein